MQPHMPIWTQRLPADIRRRLELAVAAAIEARSETHARQALNVVAVLAVALGVGFVASALVAYALSRQLGLLEAEPRSTHA